MSVGGAPHLDGDYTVFGEVVSGMSVLNRISNVKVDDYNWPKNEVIIDSIRAY
jgi:cyclophilin family peptidyl-prolyl cis-trans isomerase